MLTLEMHRRAQVFSHVDPRGVTRHFHIYTLEQFIQRNFALCLDEWVSLVPLQTAMICKTREIDPNTIEMIPAASKISDPGIAVRFKKDNTTLIVDGNHRWVRRFMRGYQDMQFVVIPEPFWEVALVPHDVVLKATGGAEPWKLAGQ